MCFIFYTTRIKSGGQAIFEGYFLKKKTLNTENWSAKMWCWLLSGILFSLGMHVFLGKHTQTHWDWTRSTAWDSYSITFNVKNLLWEEKNAQLIWNTIYSFCIPKSLALTSTSAIFLKFCDTRAVICSAAWISLVRCLLLLSLGIASHAAILSFWTKLFTVLTNAC